MKKTLILLFMVLSLFIYCSGTSNEELLTSTAWIGNIYDQDGTAREVKIKFETDDTFKMISTKSPFFISHGTYTADFDQGTFEGEVTTLENVDEFETIIISNVEDVSTNFPEVTDIKFTDTELKAKDQYGYSLVFLKTSFPTKQEIIDASTRLNVELKYTDSSFNGKMSAVMGVTFDVADQEMNSYCMNLTYVTNDTANVRLYIPNTKFTSTTTNILVMGTMFTFSNEIPSMGAMTGGATAYMPEDMKMDFTNFEVTRYITNTLTLSIYPISNIQMTPSDFSSDTPVISWAENHDSGKYSITVIGPSKTNANSTAVYMTNNPLFPISGTNVTYNPNANAIPLTQLSNGQIIQVILACYKTSNLTEIELTGMGIKNFTNAN